MVDTKEKSIRVWSASPAGLTHAYGLEPGSRAFFDAVLKRRSEYEIPWLFDLVPFTSFRNRKVLEVGCGAGYDAYEFCRNGADYTGIDIAPENIERTKKHLSFYGYSPIILEGDAENLEFEDESFDMVFSNGVLHHIPDINKSFREIYRVLRKGGEFWVIVYHKNSIYYWLKLFVFDHILNFGFLKRSFRERLSMVEYTTSDELPIVNVYSRNELEKLLSNNGFNVENLWVRKLVKEDLPMLALPYIIKIQWKIWQNVPQRWLDFIGRRFGWYIIASAKKV